MLANIQYFLSPSSEINFSLSIYYTPYTVPGAECPVCSEVLAHSPVEPGL